MFIPGVIALWVAFAALCASTVNYVLSMRGKEAARVQARQFYALATFGVVAASLRGAAERSLLVLSAGMMLPEVGAVKSSGPFSPTR